MEQVPLKVHDFLEGSTKNEHHNRQTRTHTLASCYPLIGPSKEITVDAHPRYTRYSNFKSRVGSLAPTHSHLGIIAGCIPSPQLNMCFILPRRWHFYKGATVLQVARWKLSVVLFYFLPKNHPQCCAWICEMSGSFELDRPTWLRGTVRRCQRVATQLSWNKHMQTNISFTVNWKILNRFYQFSSLLVCTSSNQWLCVFWWCPLIWFLASNEHKRTSNMFAKRAIEFMTSSNCQAAFF